MQSHQRGSILSFILVGAALALLLIGGAYLVRNRLFPAVTGPEVAVTEGDETSQLQPDTEQTPEASKDETPEQAPAPKPEQTTPQTGFTPVTPAPAAPQNTGSGTTPSSGLPETGPSEVLIGGLMMSGLVAIAFIYLRSREHATSL